MTEITAEQRDPWRERVRMALEAHWACGPGDMLTEAAPGPNGYGEPYEIAVGQICRSSAHNYAYWNGTCQFATEAADALADVMPPPTYLPDPDGSFAMYLIEKERAEQAEAALERVRALAADWEDRCVLPDRHRLCKGARLRAALRGDG